jgi:hypothetical protein
MGETKAYRHEKDGRLDIDFTGRWQPGDSSCHQWRLRNCGAGNHPELVDAHDVISLLGAHS